MLERDGKLFPPANTGHPPSVVYGAVLGYMVQEGLPGKYKDSQEIRLLFPIVSISSYKGAFLCHVCCFSVT